MKIKKSFFSSKKSYRWTNTISQLPQNCRLFHLHCTLFWLELFFEKQNFASCLLESFKTVSERVESIRREGRVRASSGLQMEH